MNVEPGRVFRVVKPDQFETVVRLSPQYVAGRRRVFAWRGYLVDVRMFGNLWVIEYFDGWPYGKRRGSISFHRGTSPADVAVGIMRELRSTL